METLTEGALAVVEQIGEPSTVPAVTPAVVPNYDEYRTNWIKAYEEMTGCTHTSAVRQFSRDKEKHKTDFPPMPQPAQSHKAISGGKSKKAPKAVKAPKVKAAPKEKSATAKEKEERDAHIVALLKQGKTNPEVQKLTGMSYAWIRWMGIKNGVIKRGKARK